MGGVLLEGKHDRKTFYFVYSMCECELREEKKLRENCSLQMNGVCFQSLTKFIQSFLI